MRAIDCSSQKSAKEFGKPTAAKDFEQYVIHTLLALHLEPFKGLCLPYISPKNCTPPKTTVVRARAAPQTEINDSIHPPRYGCFAPLTLQAAFRARLGLKFVTQQGFSLGENDGGIT